VPALSVVPPEWLLGLVRLRVPVPAAVSVRAPPLSGDVARERRSRGVVGRHLAAAHEGGGAGEGDRVVPPVVTVPLSSSGFAMDTDPVLMIVPPLGLIGRC